MISGKIPGLAQIAAFFVAATRSACIGNKGRHGSVDRLKAFDAVTMCLSALERGSDGKAPGALDRPNAPKQRSRREWLGKCLSFEGPGQPCDRRCNDLVRIAAEAQHQRRLRGCLHIQAAHGTNDNALLQRCLLDSDV